LNLFPDRQTSTVITLEDYRFNCLVILEVSSLLTGEYPNTDITFSVSLSTGYSSHSLPHSALDILC
jgi:hypothetical protein